jgi:PhoH-like ATPase
MEPIYIKKAGKTLSDTTLFQGISVIQTVKENIDKLYKDGEIEIFDKRYNLEAHQNQYVVLNDKIYNERREEIYPGSGSSAITRVKGNKLVRVSIDKDTLISGIRPKNKEQIMAFDALLDPSIEVVTLTGTPGSGKTLLALAAALHLIEQGVYKKIIISRQMYQVGNVELGILPGEISQKFHPFLMNYMCNFEYLLGRHNKDGKIDMDDLVEQYHIDFVPFQLIRGASWPNTLVLMDEFQNANRHEILTLGTRIGEGSKLIIAGDLNQRDTGIAKKNTGLYQWVNSSISQESKLTSSIHLIKSERSEICRLFATVFEEE